MSNEMEAEEIRNPDTHSGGIMTLAEAVVMNSTNEDSLGTTNFADAVVMNSTNEDSLGTTNFADAVKNDLICLDGVDKNNQLIKVYWCRFCNVKIKSTPNCLYQHLLNVFHHRNKVKAYLDGPSTFTPANANTEAQPMRNTQTVATYVNTDHNGYRSKPEEGMDAQCSPGWNYSSKQAAGTSLNPLPILASSMSLPKSSNNSSLQVHASRPISCEQNFFCKAGQFVRISWKYFKLALNTMYSDIQDQALFSDVTLSCEGKNFYCHRIILSACSKYFTDVLTLELQGDHYKGHQERHQPIILLNMKIWEIQALIDFMYKGEVIIPQEHLGNLVNAAKSLQIYGLSSVTIKSNVETKVLIQKGIHPSVCIDFVKGYGDGIGSKKNVESNPSIGTGNFGLGLNNSPLPRVSTKKKVATNRNVSGKITPRDFQKGMTSILPGPIITSRSKVKNIKTYKKDKRQRQLMAPSSSLTSFSSALMSLAEVAEERAMQDKLIQEVNSKSCEETSDTNYCEIVGEFAVEVNDVTNEMEMSNWI